MIVRETQPARVRKGFSGLNIDRAGERMVEMIESEEREEGSTTSSEQGRAEPEQSKAE